MQSQNKYIVFILSHKRADKVFTYKTLRKQGYSGPIRIVIDDLDDSREEYEKKYPGEIIVFDKRKASELFDAGDNFKTYRGVVYARNAVFKIAKDLGYEYFIVLDDDYRHFQYRFDYKLNYNPMVIRDLDRIFNILVDFFSSANLDSLAISQGGDFIGGEENQNAEKVKLTRKLMNLFVCSSSRPFEIMGRINEDVNAYVLLGSRGNKFFSYNQLSLEQTQTQANAGGMTELYLDSGTYVKSFYSVIFAPSSVSVGVLQDRENFRLHHRVKWVNAVPKILRENVRK